jgi:hypothetical protein
VDADVRALLATARSAVTGELKLRPARASRTGAVLARSALEIAVGREIDLLAPGAVRGTMRSKLIVLKTLGDATTGPETAWAWVELSRNCHQHAYELSPTPGEMERSVGRVESIVARLGGK